MSNDDTSPAEFYRLPYDVAPRRYELLLAPDLANASFVGEERIELDVVERTDRIVMNALDLEISDAAIEAERGAGDGEAAKRPLSISFDESLEQVTFSSPEPIEPGRYRFSCSFSGTLNDKLCGFYRSTFVGDDGAEKTIATTQFEETDARRAFPCFDEPDRKAVFSVTLEVEGDLMAVSNGPEIELIELDGGRRRVRFGDTIAMSTYLVAFIVGPLEATEPIDVDGVALRVVHVPGKKHLTAAALDAAAHSLRFYTEYFALPYPGEKLDLIGLPDFAAGAMENLGCVTFREAILLSDPAATSRAELERLVEVVDHEIAHMWFGDLVTMRWWNGIWLNEAFATFMALCCEDDYRPEWQSFSSFSRSKAGALAVDGLHSTRPIEFPVRHPDEAAAMFDVLTYEKGASVLWMLERYLGREVFRAGVRRYLAAHQFANTETTDLWDAIELEAGNEPVRSLMDSWIFQGGYPLVTVQSNNDRLELTQAPFSYLNETTASDTSAIGRDWFVPVLTASLDRRDKTERVLLGSEPALISSNGNAVVVNAGGSGFYRTSYDEGLRTTLLSRLFDFEPIERYNFVGDVWALSLSGRIEADDFVDVLKRLSSERDPYVWSIGLGALSMFDLVADDAARPAIAAATKALLAPILEEIGIDASDRDGELTPLLRSSIFSTLGLIGEDETVIAAARERFAADHKGRTPIDSDLASAVLSVVMAHATREEFDAVVERHRNPRDPMDEVRHLNALASVREPAFADEIYARCRGEIRSQNAPYLLAAMLQNRAIGKWTWRFITASYDDLVQRFPDNSIHRMLSGITGLATLGPDGEAHLADEVRAFCNERVDGARRRLVAQSLERLEVNVAFAKRLRGHLGSMFSSTAPTSA